MHIYVVCNANFITENLLYLNIRRVEKHQMVTPLHRLLTKNMGIHPPSYYVYNYKHVWNKASHFKYVLIKLFWSLQSDLDVDRYDPCYKYTLILGNTNVIRYN